MTRDVMEETREDLLTALHLISDADHWTTHTLARDASGCVVGYRSPYATQWCAIGAVVTGIVRADYLWSSPRAVTARRTLDAVSLNNDAASDNDLEGHQAVMDMYDNALAVLQPSDLTDYYVGR